jgi:hypothetical protein
MEAWRVAWRAFAAGLTLEQLDAIEHGLVSDDPALVQGATTTPPPLQCVLDWQCEGACLIGYAGWKGSGIGTVGEVEDFFADRCHAADQAMGEPAGCRHLLNAFDDWPRDEMIANLLPEVRRAIAERERATELVT